MANGDTFSTSTQTCISPLLTIESAIKILRNHRLSVVQTSDGGFYINGSGALYTGEQLIARARGLQEPQR